MIIRSEGQAHDADHLKEQLQECGAVVNRSFELIEGVSAHLSPDALKKFFARHPRAKALPDRRRQLPPMRFGPDDWQEANRPAGSEDGAAPSPQEAEMSPLALSLIQADEAHKLGIDGTGVRVCLVDSGVDFNHPDLQGTAVLGPDGQILAVDFTETDLTDTVGHGTGVAGSVAAQARQLYTIANETTGKPVGYTRIKGMAPGARLMSAKVFDTRVDSGYDSTIVAALEWAAANGAQIVNMSLGATEMPNDGTDLLAAAVTSLRQRGILVVVAAGNNGGGIGTLQSPGSSPGALTVGASTMYRSFAELGYLTESNRWTADQLASFSSLGPAADGRIKPDILAPGAYDWGLAPVMTSEEGQNFQLFGGTSQAAPLTAGAAALVYQAFQKAHGRFPTPDEAVQILCATADDLGFPAHMQGAGRINGLKAVQAILKPGQTIIASPLDRVVVRPGSEEKVSLNLANLGAAAVQARVDAVTYGAAGQSDQQFTGEITPAQPTQYIAFQVPQGTDLMQAALDWQTEDHGPRSPRLLVALYDPDGNFVNYQGPNGSGDVELGKCVDAWVGHPMPGEWKARINLRLGTAETQQSFTFSVRRFRRTPWNWVKAPAEPQSLAPGEQKPVTLAVQVPAKTAAGTYTGHLQVGAAVVPFSVVVPVDLAQGEGTFAGAFQHGYQGSWGNGDWFYHDIPVPGGVPSLVAALQWPDVDNALECYLVGPDGNPVMGRSNDKDIMDDGDSHQLGGQMILARPAPGNWRMVLHSFAFSGRGMPEPYFGTVATAGELVSPRSFQLTISRNEEAPLALVVKNPGRLPISVQAVGQSTEPRLIWQTLASDLKTGVTQNGQAEGTGHVTLATIDVPVGANQLGVLVNCSEPGVAVSLSLFDPVAESDRSTITSEQGQLSLMESVPVPGQWTLMAGITAPTGTGKNSNKKITLTGAVFVVAPQPLTEITAAPVTVQPGGQAVVPLTIKLPEGVDNLDGNLVVTTAKGDRLGEVPFSIKVEPV